jgi:hypothetical protein
MITLLLLEIKRNSGVVFGKMGGIWDLWLEMARRIGGVMTPPYAVIRCYQL